MLTLLHASGASHMARKDNNFDNLDFFHELKLNAFNIFSRLNDYEGMADCYFLWAMMSIMDTSPTSAKFIRRSPISPSAAGSAFDLSAGMREVVGSVTSDGGGKNAELIKMFGGETIDEHGNRIAIIKMHESLTASECLDEALRLFRLAESTMSRDCSFNIAKCLYEKC